LARGGKAQIGGMGVIRQLGGVLPKLRSLHADAVAQPKYCTEATLPSIAFVRIIQRCHLVKLVISRNFIVAG
jgi:hypothetical protein